MALESDFYYKTNLLGMTTLNNSFNMNSSFDDERFDLWKSRMKIFLDVVDFDLWDCVTNGSFIPTYIVNCDVVDNPSNTWTEEKNIKYNLVLKLIN